MKIASFSQDGRQRLAVIHGDVAADLGSSPDVPTTLGELLAATDNPAALLLPALRTAPRLPLAHLELRAPLDAPRHFFAVGLNYRAHGSESAPPPSRPRLFTKLASSITGPHSDIVDPALSDTLDCEGELGVVIGQRCRHVPRARAPEVVAGYLIVNDVTLREWVHPDLLVLAKGCATFAPLGPWLTTSDEVPDPHALRIQTAVNGDVRQAGNTSQMVFDCWTLIEWITRAIELQPGDLIATGAPGASGSGEPLRYLRPGDRITVRIDRLGEIANTVRRGNAT